ncbi:MAG: hypothetical protein HYT86_04480 [candidate division NC10 bacterium]|nr:hypothetical protein [candidate division NC10 bacterium]
MQEHPRISAQRRYISERAADLLARLPDMEETDLRYFLRVLADCLLPEEQEEYLSGYSEHLPLPQIQAFAERFIPRYTTRALADLDAKRFTAGDRLADLTDEELQSMSAAEKWSLLAADPSGLTLPRLRRELARLFMSGTYDLFHDTGTAESAVEFPVYHHLQAALSGLPPDVITALAADIQREAEALAGHDPDRTEAALRAARTAIGRAAGLPEPFEERFGGRMARLPLEAAEVPPAYVPPEVAEGIAEMPLEQLQDSLRVLCDLMSLEEIQRELQPLQAQYLSMQAVPHEALARALPPLAARLGDRRLTDFVERYRIGRLAARRPVSLHVWRMLPFGEKLALLEADNDAMDAAQAARHLAKIFCCPRYELLGDSRYHLELLRGRLYPSLLDCCLLEFARPPHEARLRDLTRTVTRLMLEMEEGEEAEREERLLAIRRRIGEALDVPERLIAPQVGEA